MAEQQQLAPLQQQTYIKPSFCTVGHLNIKNGCILFGYPLLASDGFHQLSANFYVHSYLLTYEYGPFSNCSALAWISTSFISFEANLEDRATVEFVIY